MILKSLTIHNIRSYTNQKINFPLGSLLLSGDIGSGKSTILLAIEFALFGIKPGELTGRSLLRYGEKEGFVELIFEINGMEVLVNRSLKKSKDRIVQGAGFIVKEGKKSELMPKEIRAQIYELLNYPMDQVSKGQDLIYRFTVYTPQEEMKKIIYEDADSRLNTLRKVFNIDKYKKIKDSSIVYCRYQREKIISLEAKCEDINSVLNLKSEIKEKIKENESKCKIAQEEFTKELEKFTNCKTKIFGFEENIKKLNLKKEEFSILNEKLENTLSNRESALEELRSIDIQIKNLKEELINFDDVNLEDKEKNKEIEYERIEKDLMLLRSSIGEIKGELKHLQETAQKIVDLDNCPVCKQDVSTTHKRVIVAKTNQKISSLGNDNSNLENKEKDISKLLKNQKADLRKIANDIALNKSLKIKKSLYMEKENKQILLTKILDESKLKIGAINTQKIALQKELDLFKDIERDYILEKENYELYSSKVKNTEIILNSNKLELKNFKDQLESIDKEIKVKNLQLKEAKKLKELRSFLLGNFSKLVSNVENHIMMSIYNEFNELFKKWFDCLMEDDNISAHLDTNFDVTVVQNGYESDIYNLSGGEKTSVALSYRLALNKAINDISSHLNTKDLIILDEPTDGFSSQQLDKIRDLIEDLKMKQIILVSHENKIESFVDHVIRLNKLESTSEIID